jgi:hypothetical protein
MERISAEGRHQIAQRRDVRVTGGSDREGNGPKCHRKKRSMKKNKTNGYFNYLTINKLDSQLDQ